MPALGPIHSPVHVHGLLELWGAELPSSDLLATGERVREQLDADGHRRGPLHGHHSPLPAAHEGQRLPDRHLRHLADDARDIAALLPVRVPRPNSRHMGVRGELAERDVRADLQHPDGGAAVRDTFFHHRGLLHLRVEEAQRSRAARQSQRQPRGKGTKEDEEDGEDDRQHGRHVSHPLASHLLRQLPRGRLHDFRKSALFQRYVPLLPRRRDDELVLQSVSLRLAQRELSGGVQIGE